MEAVIFVNGSINNYNHLYKYTFNKYIICADGGVIHTKKMNINPDIIIGDLDSAPEDIILEYQKQGITINKFPTKKDFTDTELCIDYAISKGFNDIIILGALGGRIDHTIGNINLLDKCLFNKIKVCLIGDEEYILITDDKITLKEKIGTNISLIPFSEYVTGVNSKGLEYILINHTLKRSSSTGLSNVINYKESEISIKTGKLLIIVSNK